MTKYQGLKPFTSPASKGLTREWPGSAIINPSKTLAMGNLMMSITRIVISTMLTKKDWKKSVTRTAI